MQESMSPMRAVAVGIDGLSRSRVLLDRLVVLSCLYCVAD
jgi:hypothetical protein